MKLYLTSCKTYFDCVYPENISLFSCKINAFFYCIKNRKYFHHNWFNFFSPKLAILLFKNVEWMIFTLCIQSPIKKFTITVTFFSMEWFSFLILVLVLSFFRGFLFLFASWRVSFPLSTIHDWSMTSFGFVRRPQDPPTTFKNSQMADCNCQNMHCIALRCTRPPS